MDERVRGGRRPSLRCSFHSDCDREQCIGHLDFHGCVVKRQRDWGRRSEGEWQRALFITVSDPSHHHHHCNDQLPEEGTIIPGILMNGSPLKLN